MNINSNIVAGVKEFLDGGDRSFLSDLLAGPRDNVEGQAVVRYLMQIKHWPFTPGSEFAETLEHLFGEYPERKKMDPEEYRTTTEKMILEAFDYQCIEVVPEPKPEPKPNPGKRTKRPQMVKDDDGEEEGESGSKTFKSIREQEAEA